MELLTVSDEAVADYLPRCEFLAKPLVNLHNSGAEFDDLVQEGLIFCWQSLQRGVKPRTEFIRGRMLNWIRLLDRQTEGVGASYDEIMEAGGDPELG